MALFNDAVNVLRAPLSADAYGSHRDWDQAVTVWAGTGALLLYRRPFEARSAERETTRTRATLYLVGSVPLDSADRLLVNGVQWEADGAPWPWRLGASRRYTQIDVKRVAK